MSTGSILTYGADPTGSSDSTSAITSAIAALDTIYFPAGTYKVSAFAVPANKTITTDGFETVIVQASGTGPNTRMLSVTGSNVRIGDLKFEGRLNQSGDTTGEQNQAVFVNAGSADIDNVTIGNITGTNIRGDVVLLYGAGGNTASNISVGHVSGDNVYRHVVAIVGSVEGADIATITGTQVGFGHIDIEADASAGFTQSVRVGYLKGNYALVACPTAVDYADGIEFGMLDLDPTGHGSTPAYVTPGGTPVNNVLKGNAFAVRNCKSVKIEKFRAEGFDGQAVKQEYEGTPPADLGNQYIHIGQAELIDCCKTDTLYYSYIQGGTGVTRLRIDHLIAETTTANQRVIGNCDNAIIGVADITLVTGTTYMANCNNSLTQTFNQSGGNGLVGCVACSIAGGIQNGDYLFSYSTRCVVSNSDVTMSSSYDNNGTDNSIWTSEVGGTYYFAYTVAPEFEVDADGGIRSKGPTAGVGYRTGSGGTVTQATSKATAVTLNNVTGRITMSNAALAATTSVFFTLNNSAIAATDTVTATIASGGTADAYTVSVPEVTAGSCRIRLRNETGGSLSEAVVVNFSVWKGAIS